MPSRYPLRHQQLQLRRVPSGHWRLPASHPFGGINYNFGEVKPVSFGGINYNFGDYQTVIFPASSTPTPTATACRMRANMYKTPHYDDIINYNFGEYQAVSFGGINYNFGDYQAVTFGGTVFQDTNGVQGGGERPARLSGKNCRPWQHGKEPDHRTPKTAWRRA